MVVLIFCTQNDRGDNSTNIRYEGYQKPYFATASDGSLVLQGQPVPKSRLQYIKEDWLVRNLWLARLVAASYVGVRYPLLYVPDPTERLVSTIRDFVEANGGRAVFFTATDSYVWGTIVDSDGDISGWHRFFERADRYTFGSNIQPNSR